MGGAPLSRLVITDMAILTAERLTVQRIDGSAGALLLNDFSISLESGETVGLTGPSGAGKSLTALTLCGLLDPPLAWTAGRILIDGQIIAPARPRSWDRHRGKGIFLIFQSPASALNPRIKIGTQIIEALKAVRNLTAIEANEEARSLLHRVDLPADTVARYPFQLSGGMRQRVLVAIALGLRPKVVVADEPTSGLDPVRQAEVMTVLRRLPDELGTGLVILSHDIRLFDRIANRVGVLYEGRLVELNATHELLRRPRHPWTRAMVESLAALRIGDAAASPG